MRAPTTAAKAAPHAQRTVFFVSDGTGITAETFGNSILAQFPGQPRHVRRPFIDSVDKAAQVVGDQRDRGQGGQAADRLHHPGQRRGARHR
jgi:regulator of PEP synthase PpsR (kinase-PPPase family)